MLSYSTQQTFSENTFNPILTPCRVASTANLAGTYFNGNTNNGVGATLTLAGPLTIDGVSSFNVGLDRIILFQQTNVNENGIYVITQNSTISILTRSQDFQCIEQLIPGQFITIFDGGQAGSNFTLINPLPHQFGIPGNAIVFIKNT